MIFGYKYNISAFFVAMLALVFLLPISALAQQGDELPVYLEAEIIDHDQALNIITARGKVIVKYEGRTLSADTLSYNRNTGLISASGNISLVEANGQVLTTNYLTLDERMQDGVIHALQYQIDKNARLAANGAVRKQGRYVDMAKAVYSVCKACEENPERPLLWQVKADQVTHDNVEKMLYYYDARVEVLGVPVLYTPYLSHADPSVERKTGFLPPRFGTSDSNAYYIQPYYWTISPYQDATVEPVYANREAGGNSLLGFEYRRQIEQGGFTIKGAFSDEQDTLHNDDKDDNGSLIGYVQTTGNKDFNSRWRGNYQLAITNDREFTSDNPYWGAPTNYFENTVVVEGFNQQNYIKADALWYQELETGDETDHPIILPQFNYNGQTKADSYGGRFKFDVAARQYSKGPLVESGQRLNMDGAYTIPLLLSGGLIAKSNLNLRGDLYNSEFTEEAKQADSDLEDGTAVRFVPSANFIASYPLSRLSGAGRQIIEPVVGLFVAPNDTKNDEAIANTDGTLFETSDTNLFSDNRIPGYDRIESGSRLVTGAKFAHYFEAGERIQFFAGQSYSLSDSDTISQDLGVEEDASDIVGRLNVQANRFGSYNYSFNLSADDLDLQKNELDFAIGEPAFKLSGGYSYVSKNIMTDDEDLERIYATATSRIDRQWRSSFSGTRDLEDQRALSTALNLIYEDECFILNSSLSNTYNDDDEDERKIMLTFTLKSLGSYSANPDVIK